MTVDWLLRILAGNNFDINNSNGNNNNNNNNNNKGTNYPNGGTKASETGPGDINQIISSGANGAGIPDSPQRPFPVPADTFYRDSFFATDLKLPSFSPGYPAFFILVLFVSLTTFAFFILVFLCCIDTDSNTAPIKRPPPLSSIPESPPENDDEEEEPEFEDGEEEGEEEDIDLDEVYVPTFADAGTSPIPDLNEDQVEDDTVVIEAEPEDATNENEENEQPDGNDTKP